jgi:hypothetical protein
VIEMPFKSEAQRRFFYAATRPGFRGDADITKKDVKKWEAETPKGKDLPERVSKKAHLQLAFEIGKEQALREAGIEKEAGIESRLGNVLQRTAHLWAPAAAGGVVAGPEHRMEGALAGLGLGILGKRIGRGTLSRGIFDPHEVALAEEAAKLAPESAKYRAIIKGLGERAPEFEKGLKTLRAQGPMFEWGGRLAGGLGGGYLANKLLSGRPLSSYFDTAPAVSDITTHYTGLAP